MAPDSVGAHTPRKDGHRERIGNYVLGPEIGRGSFATVYKAYRSKSHEVIAIKAVSRSKLTTKLLENLESEINILKAINHRNVVALTDCFKNDSQIYLVMEFCSGADLSIYIKKRGQIETLDFFPRFLENGMVQSTGGKVFWPHPLNHGLDERVTRCFLGQLAHAVRFLRSQNLIHRDIKPQNLLLQPASASEMADGHPLGIPVLKVADFGFARILPAAAMAETLCGSPLYMAPEILRYEKYDAKADLWSIGAVLYEMASGRSPFRATNHVELLRKIEKGEDRIKFPDESSKASQPTIADDGSVQSPPHPVSADIKALIRGLLKRKPAERMGFEEFFASGVWDGYMTESNEDGSTSIDVSTDSSAVLSESRVRDLVESAERLRDKALPIRAPQPLSTDPALNPSPAPMPHRRSSEGQTPTLEQNGPDRSDEPTPPPRIRRSEPKYYVSDEPAPPSPTSTPSSPTPQPGIATQPTPPFAVPPGTSTAASPRPIQSTAVRRLSSRSKEPASVEDAPPLTPTGHPVRAIGGSPLAATPPITMTGKDESALDASDSVGREYVVVEKRTVEINALADELEQNAKRPSTAPVRKPSQRNSVVSRPVSSFKPAPSPPQQAVVLGSYSPPFALGTTPPFAIPPTVRHTPALSRPPSIPQALNVFPPTTYTDSAGLPVTRFSSSPSSLQTGALARALTNTAIRLIGTSANSAATAIARGMAAKRRPTVLRSVDPDEADLLDYLEDMARKAFVLFDFADTRIVVWHQIRPASSYQQQAAGQLGSQSSTGRRRSSHTSISSVNSDVTALRQQESAASDACVLYFKALAFVCTGHERFKRYWEERRDRDVQYEPSADLNDTVQWFRARFNELYDKAEWAKARCAEELPFVERLVYERALEVSRQSALVEMQGDYASAEQGYETALWFLSSLLDEVMYDGAKVSDDDRQTVERFVDSVQKRLSALKSKMGETE